MKNFLFYGFSFFLIIFLILIFDFISSNTILNYKSCIKYEKFYYELKKNCKGNYRFKKSFPIVETITDNMGLRIGKNSPKKNSEKKNIFIFGDSFTYGVGIDYDKTYVGLLENDNKNFNFYNFSVGSYSPSVHLYKLKKILSKNIFPEKIILFLDFTDVLDEVNRWEYDENLNLVNLKSDNLYQRSLRKKKFTKRNFKIMTNISSYINYNLRNVREKTKIKFQNERKIKTSIQGSFTYKDKEMLDKRFWKENTFDEGIATLKLRLTEISKISKKNDFEFFIVIYPWAETLEFGQEKFNWSKFVHQLCLKINCKVVDAIPEFEKYKEQNINWSTDLYFLNDEHFNEDGAYLIYKKIKESINFN